MDKRFIFRYRLQTIKSSQVTLGDRPGVALELPPPSTQSWERSRGEVRGSCAARQGDPVESPGQEKPWKGCCRRPYRKPTQVGGGKHPKVDGRPLVKELGKLVP